MILAFSINVQCKLVSCELSGPQQSVEAWAQQSLSLSFSLSLNVDLITTLHAFPYLEHIDWHGFANILPRKYPLEVRQFEKDDCHPENRGSFRLLPQLN